MRKFVDLCG